MLRMNVFAAALLVGWGITQVACAEEKPAPQVGLPPTVADTPRETKIEAALREPCTLDFDESSLQDAVDYIRQKFEIDVKLDQRALDDAAIDASVLVTFHVKDLPLGSALELILEDFDLSYIVQHGMLKITSREKADGILTKRVYPIADLVNPVQTVQGVRPKANVGPLIQLIEDTIAPDSWDTNSGIGSIRQFRTPGGMSLVISNTRPVQIQIATLLADLRAIKQPAVEAQAAGPQAPYRAMYDLGAVSGPAMAKAITAAVAPESWEGNGGAGVICAVPVSVLENLGPTLANKDAPEPQRAVVKHWKLVVLQTEDAHQQIEDLIAPISAKLSGAGCGGGFMSISPKNKPAAVDASAVWATPEIDR